MVCSLGVGLVGGWGEVRKIWVGLDVALGVIWWRPQWMDFGLVLTRPGRGMVWLSALT